MTQMPDRSGPGDTFLHNYTWSRASGYAFPRGAWERGVRVVKGHL